MYKYIYIIYIFVYVCVYEKLYEYSYSVMVVLFSYWNSSPACSNASDRQASIFLCHACDFLSRDSKCYRCIKYNRENKINTVKLMVKKKENNIRKNKSR